MCLGVITSFCVDSKNSWLTLGTSSGYHICWDLRFQLPLSSVAHPNGQYHNFSHYLLDALSACAFTVCWRPHLHHEWSFWIFFWTGARVRRLAKHPTEPSWVLSAVQGNNEISMWNMETGFRQVVLWASNTPPLSQTQVNIVIFYCFKEGHNGTLEPVKHFIDLMGIKKVKQPYAFFLPKSWNFFPAFSNKKI